MMVGHAGRHRNNSDSLFWSTILAGTISFSRDRVFQEMYSNLHLIARDTGSFRRSVKVEKLPNSNPNQSPDGPHPQSAPKQPAWTIYFPFSPHTLSERKESSSDSK